ncbi:MAG: OmpA family protein [Gammaproteobacteria bacterium]
MKKILLCSASLAGLMVSGCATQQGATFESFQAVDLNEQVKSGRFVQKTDNLVVIFDDSDSMNETFKNPGYPAEPTASKFSVEKEILTRMNQTIPDINFTSEIRSFGFGSCTDWSWTKLNKPLDVHTPDGFDAGLANLKCASGGSPMNSALDAASGDLNAASGKTAVLVISDGHDLDGSPYPSASALKAKYGDGLCIYGIWVGNPEEASGHLLLQNLSNISGCGFVKDAAGVSSPADMANFVQRVFFDLAQPKVDPCSLDDDGDGVGNCQDKCPDTPRGAKVDATGCWIYRGVLFDTDKAVIKPQFVPMLNNAVDVMGLNPGLTVMIEGHTDSRGTDAHNLALSERRAASVKKYMVDHGVSASRMETIGYGESRPIDTNATPEGMYNNRRVEFKRTDKPIYAPGFGDDQLKPQ